MVEKNPWWRNVSGPFPAWEGPIGCKADGGGCHYARGKVGKMLIHTATHNKDADGTRSCLRIESILTQYLKDILGLCADLSICTFFSSHLLSAWTTWRDICSYQKAR